MRFAIRDASAGSPAAAGGGVFGGAPCIVKFIAGGSAPRRTGSCAGSCARPESGHMIAEPVTRANRSFTRSGYDKLRLGGTRARVFRRHQGGRARTGENDG